MICLIEALDFRCLRYVRQRLGQFQVLVGPNASGKTTFLDVVGFLGRLVADGLEAAVGERTQDFVDLVWGRTGFGFELAIEATIPDAVRSRLAKPVYDTIRYEVGIGQASQTSEVAITTEQGWLKVSKPHQNLQRGLFPTLHEAPATLFSKPPQARPLFSKTPGVSVPLECL